MAKTFAEMDAPPAEAPRQLSALDWRAEFVEAVYVDGVRAALVVAYDMDAGTADVLDMARYEAGARSCTFTLHGAITVDWCPPATLRD